MKDQYVADIGDYGKYSLLRAFSLSGIKIGINWYLTDNDGSHDGKFTDYLKEPDKFGMYDPEVFKELQKVAARGCKKSVYDIQKRSILPGAIYYSERLKPPITSFEREDERIRWFKESEPVLRDAKLIFLDPDNGLLKNDNARKRGAEKYALPREIIRYYEKHNVVYYCHKGRRKNDQWIAYKRLMFDLIPDARPIILTYHKGTQRSYVFLIHEKDYQNYRSIISDVLIHWKTVFEEENIFS